MSEKGTVTERMGFVAVTNLAQRHNRHVTVAIAAKGLDAAAWAIAFVHAEQRLSETCRYRIDRGRLCITGKTHDEVEVYIVISVSDEAEQAFRPLDEVDTRWIFEECMPLRFRSETPRNTPYFIHHPI